jgi:hypothetical protein
MGRKCIDLTGQRFGKLIVIKRDINNKKGHTYWLCKCDCDKLKIIRNDLLKNNSNKSCGCNNKIESLVRRRFGKLIVLSRDKNNKFNQITWKCKCDCGNELTVVGDNLKNNRTKSCGCFRSEFAKSKLIDLSGKKFGKLTVLKRVENKGKQIRWLCLCDCGNYHEVVGSCLKNGSCKSCGCLRKELDFARMIEDQDFKITYNEIYDKIDWSATAAGDPCYNWMGSTNKKGYATLIRKISGKWVPKTVNRLLLGLIDPKKMACHTCDNKSCVRMEHLYVGDAYTNQKDRAERNIESWTRGENHSTAKLTEKDVIKIRQSNKSDRSMIIEKLNISKSTYYAIKSKRLWKHI